MSPRKVETALATVTLSASALAMCLALPVQANSPADDIAFIRRQIEQLEAAGIDASEMRATLRQMEAEAATRAAPSEPVRTAENTQGQLLGAWQHPTKGTWTFGADGKATLVRDSVNGIPGRYTITMRWSQEGTNTLVYTPIRNTLVGSPDSDRDEPIAEPKTYRAPFELVNGVLFLGGAEYQRR